MPAAHLHIAFIPHMNPDLCLLSEHSAITLWGGKEFQEMLTEKTVSQGGKFKHPLFPSDQSLVQSTLPRPMLLVTEKENCKDFQKA